MPTRDALKRIGCCGFPLAQAAYQRAFDCVEINSTLYNLPRAATAARWRQTAPAGFVFCLKAWQVITHRPTSPTYQRTRLVDSDREHCGHFGFNPTVRWAWDQTFATAKILEAAVVVFQCPASFRPTKLNLGRLRMFFERAKRGKLQFAWEPRGDWAAELVGELCHELDLLPVIDPFQQAMLRDGRQRYFRLHGISGPQHKFTNDQLRELAGWLKGRPAPFCFFNNLAMAADAARLRALVQGEGG